MLINIFHLNQIIERNLLKIYGLLPEKIRIRSYFIFWGFLPFIVLKIVKRKTLRYRGISKNGDKIEKTIDGFSKNNEYFKSLSDDFPDQDICIRYSGGTDSTLAAARAAAIFRKVHLLTFNTSYNIFSFRLIPSYPMNTLTNLGLLKSHFGQDKFVHSIIELDDLRDEIYFKIYLTYIKDASFPRVSLCPACSLAMHLKTISYCGKNNIKYVTDGSNIDSGIYPWQTQHMDNLRIISEVYQSVGLRFIINPDYMNPRSEEELVRIGVLSDGIDKSDFSYRRKTQQYCIPIQFQSVCRMLHGDLEKPEKIAAAIQEFLRIGFRKYLNVQIQSRN